MFQINDDLSIYVTRGDRLFFTVTADDDGKPYQFQPGDVVRFKVYGKKDAENVVLEKDFPVLSATEQVEIYLAEDETRIGGVISKPADYWYEVELNPFDHPQTIIGYDEDGAKIFKLFPEGDEVPAYVPEPEEIPVVDKSLDLTSVRPIQNQAVAREIVKLKAAVSDNKTNTDIIADGLRTEKARLDNLIVRNAVATEQSLEYVEVITETTKSKIDGNVQSDGVTATITVNWREANQVYGGTSIEMFVIPDECRPQRVGLIHTEDGMEYSVVYELENNRYVMSIKAQNSVTVAPSGAGSVTMSYVLGEYELKDIRVGANGLIYNDAGTAVRSQFNEIEKKLSVLGDFEADTSGWTPVNVLDGYSWGEAGYTYDLYGNIVATEYTTQFTPLTQLVPAVPGASYQFAGFIGQIRIYAADKTQLDLIFTNAMANQISFTAPEDAAYFGIYYRHDSIDTEEGIAAIKLFRTTMTAEEYAACSIGLMNGRIPGVAILDKSIGVEKLAEGTIPGLPLQGKTIVNFGDSIFGNARPPEDISSYIASLTGATVHNCGFGGCRMSYHPNANYDAFSMTKLADAVANSDFSAQEAAVKSTEGDKVPGYFADGVELLKSIDFSGVDIITIAYGANDFNGVTLDNESNPMNTRTFAGALRHSIETILMAYPHIRIFVCSPTYRFWMDSNNAFTEDSDTKMGGAYYLTTDIAEKAKEIAKAYKLPYIDNYYSLGINKINRANYFPATDGAHHNANGRKLIAAHMAKELF